MKTDLFILLNILSYNILAMEQDYSAMRSAEQAAAGRSLGATIAVITLFFGLFNLAFIVPSLIYAYEGTICVELIPKEGISFNLATWLEVDAYMRVGLISLLIIVAIVSCKSLEVGASMLICTVCIILIYSLFHVAWLVVGSVLFWGQVNPTGFCEGPVQSYLYALLIISYISILCNCAVGGRVKNQN